MNNEQSSRSEAARLRFIPKKKEPVPAMKWTTPEARNFCCPRLSSEERGRRVRVRVSRVRVRIRVRVRVRDGARVRDGVSDRATFAV